MPPRDWPISQYDAPTRSGVSGSFSFDIGGALVENFVVHAHLGRMVVVGSEAVVGPLVGLAY